MLVKSKNDIEGALVAGQRVVEVHRRLVDFLAAGQTLAQIDQFVAETLRALDCTSAFLRYRIRGYPPFPSHACLSVNACIVHGTHLMSEEPIAPGDLVSIDIGVKHRGWIGDAAWTYAVEHATAEARALMDAGKESLRLGLETIRPGRPLLDWAKAVESYVERECGLHLVRGLGGHGYGRTLHGPPFLSNVTPRRPGEWSDAWLQWKPGMLVAVEPMLAIGTPETRHAPSSWPIFTADGSWSVHYEADVLVTEDGMRDLTEGLFDLPDVVGG